MRKVSLPDWNSLRLLFLLRESSLFSSILLSLDGLLPLLHLLLHECHSRSEIILIGVITHSGVSLPWLLTVMTF